ncbi:hypothetical protein HPP92_021260 [Vanilla planifolia]|uniref:SAM domain-containing protein n=1 Tax=Vanilla planifolia TaxID=51239 RepID=A0A835PZI4_VANPL|nr:hypothetical protein HPP92_021624 [Vanilla planifolia]KAG0462784.1 hypothetical protein HPP92_021260 [Vanilla planifolia]
MVGEGAVADEYWEFDEFRLECSESPSDRRLSAPGNRDAEVDAKDATEGEVPSEINGVDWNKKNGGHCWMEEDGVWSWLNQMGLGRYAPIFEMHEVDENVLPFLTLEDLKDMGINAVGSRRKMYHAIQKLQ